MHVAKALGACGYPKWVLAKGVAPTTTDRKALNKSKETIKARVPMPYISGLSEELRRIFRDHNCDLYHKPQNTLRQLLCCPKDPAKKEESTGSIYRVDCGGTSGHPCSSFYVGETERVLKDRSAEHRRPSSTTSEVSAHLHLDGRPKHHISPESISILDRDDDWLRRGIKEAIYIRGLKPDINVRPGRYNLSHTWDALIGSCNLAAAKSCDGS